MTGPALRPFVACIRRWLSSSPTYASFEIHKMERIQTDESMKSQSSRSAAANFNAKVFRKLQNAFAANPEIDLLSMFPTNYSERLNGKMNQEAGKTICPIFHLELHPILSYIPS